MAVGPAVRSWARALLVTLIVGVPPSVAAATTPAARCTVEKLAAASRSYAAAIRCHKQAIRLQLPAAPGCLDAAQADLLAALARAEARGGCAATADAATFEATIDVCVRDLVALLSPYAPTTTTTTTTTMPPPSHVCSPLFAECGGCPTCVCAGLPEFGSTGICLVPGAGGGPCSVDPPTPCPMGQVCMVTSIFPFVQTSCVVLCP